MGRELVRWYKITTEEQMDEGYLDNIEDMFGVRPKFMVEFYSTPDVKTYCASTQSSATCIFKAYILENFDAFDEQGHEASRWANMIEHEIGHEDLWYVDFTRLWSKYEDLEKHVDVEFVGEHDFDEFVSGDLDDLLEAM
jgi:hypothetical protein